MEVNLDFVYEFVRTGTSENITPMDAIKGVGGASEWVSASADPCEPYCTDIEVEQITLFPGFRPDSKDFDLGDATVSGLPGTQWH